MTKREGCQQPSLHILHILFSVCLKILHLSQEKSGILKVQSGSNEETLMPRQSLRITRRLTCDTLLKPGKRTNDVQTAQNEPSDFLCICGHFFRCPLFLTRTPVCQTAVFSEIGGHIADKGIAQEKSICQYQQRNGIRRDVGKQNQKQQTQK